MPTGTLPKRENNFTAAKTNDVQGDTRPWWYKRRWLLPLTALVAFMIGASSGDPDAALEQSQARIGQLETQLAAEQERADQATDQARAAEEARGTAEAEFARRNEELVAAPALLDTAAPPPAPAPQSPPAPAPQPAPAPAPQPAPDPGPETGCDPNYTPCIPAYPPDLDCGDIGHPVRVTGSDPHRLDRDGDGTGCDS
ncbi:MAG: hypothetical protein ACRD0K_05370 [Egibacteraceae bacterium]